MMTTADPQEVPRQTTAGLAVVWRWAAGDSLANWPTKKGGRSEPVMTRLLDWLHRLGGSPAGRKSWQKGKSVWRPLPDSGFLWAPVAAGNG
ncbi:MAG TPA: hypothetical protein VHY08_20320 [Bacillota bacterium]|nr:hypothetical protein [Bacillota bacterium]